MVYSRFSRSIPTVKPLPQDLLAYFQGLYHFWDVLPFLSTSNFFTKSQHLPSHNCCIFPLGPYVFSVSHAFKYLAVFISHSSFFFFFFSFLGRVIPFPSLHLLSYQSFHPLSHSDHLPLYTV